MINTIVPTPETAHFWQGTRCGVFLLQKCQSCAEIYFPPRPFCPACWSPGIEVFPAIGTATLYSYVISHRSAGAGFEAPFSIALVALSEGPRIVSNIIECEQTPDCLVIDMPLEMVFRENSDGFSLPLFRPAPASVLGPSS